MNFKLTIIIKDFFYVILSNFTSLLAAGLIVLIIPKLIGIDEYGYWQLYVFYSSYVGFLHFGWNDGIYLRYGGKEYDELDKGLFFSQFIMLFLFQLIIIVIILNVINFYVIDREKDFILKMTSLCMIIVNLKCMLIYILQCTGNIKAYGKITILDRLSYLLIAAIFITLGARGYKFLIISDLFGKLISFIYAMYYCKDIVFRKINTFYFSINEIINNINVGIKLMFANISSMLIIGIIRLGIERTWDVTTFGKISLTLDISNLIMVFINAIGLTIFPILRRTNEAKLSNIYSTLRDFLMMILLGILIIYYPLKFILSAWLPKYVDSLKYMAILFPICIYEGKISLLVNTYLKTLRQEKQILVINIITLFFSIILTWIIVFVKKDLNLAVLSIVVLLAFRCNLAEIYLSKILNISIFKDMVLELTMTVIFIISGWYINSWKTVLIYGLAYVMYLLIKQKDIKNSIRNLKALIKE